MIKYRHIYALLLLSSFFVGCYTQFLPNDQSLNPTDNDPLADRTIVHDTVMMAEHDRCYWTEDFWGNPVLKCYKSNYSYDWHSYHNVPWWYKRNATAYDYGRCPRYFYYDASCRSCVRGRNFRYHQGGYSNDNHSPGPSIGNPQPVTSEDKRPERPRSYGIPHQPANPSPEKITESNAKQDSGRVESPKISSEDNNVESALPRKEEPKRLPRSYGIPNANSQAKP